MDKIICDEIIGGKETSFNEKKYNLQNTKFYFNYVFINHHCIINSYQCIGNFDSSNIKIDENSCRNILIQYIGYVKLKEYINTYSAEPLHFIFIYVNGYFEEINGNKCLTLVLTNESKGKTKKTEEL